MSEQTPTNAAHYTTCINALGWANRHASSHSFPFHLIPIQPPPTPCSRPPDAHNKILLADINPSRSASPLCPTPLSTSLSPANPGQPSFFFIYVGIDLKKNPFPRTSTIALSSSQMQLCRIRRLLSLPLRSRASRSYPRAGTCKCREEWRDGAARQQQVSCVAGHH